MLRQLDILENAGLIHTQTGFSMIEKDHNDHGSRDYTIFSVNYKGESTTGLTNETKVRMMDSNYWCAIESTSSAEVIPIQALTAALPETKHTSYAQDDFTKGSNLVVTPTGNALKWYFGTVNDAFINIQPGDIIYGKFVAVAVLKTATSPAVYNLRLHHGQGYDKEIQYWSDYDE